MKVIRLASLCFISLLTAATATAELIEKPVLFSKPYPIRQNHPILTTTSIIEIYKGEQFQGIVLIKRGKIPFGIAIPGGKVEWGETVEQAVRREMKEEVNLELHDLRQFHVYSSPQRDPRHHSIEVTFLSKSFSYPQAGDDAEDAFVVTIEDIPWDELTFDHSEVLRDYIAYRNKTPSTAMMVP